MAPRADRSRKNSMCFAHGSQLKIGIYLLRAPEIISLSVGLERPVSDAFDKKFFVALEEKFRDWANPRVCAHSGPFPSPSLTETQSFW